MTSSDMAMIDTRSTLALLLLLAVFGPLQAIGGRHSDSVGATAVTLVQARSPQVQVLPDTTPAAGRRAGELGKGSMLEDDAKFQASKSSGPPSYTGWKMDRQWERKQKNTRQVGDDVDDHGHRLLVGSSAPTCQGKCGQCNPCNPIHMTIGIPHGTVTQQEYYPEVWRCKCGGVYFMP